MSTRLDANEIEVKHAIPGRVRVRIERVKEDEALADELLRALSGHPAVRRVEVSRITGSVLIQYDPGDLEAVRQRLGVLAPDLEPLPERHEGARRVRRRSAAGEDGRDWGESLNDAFATLNSRVRRATGGPDLKVIVPATLLLLGVQRMAFSKLVAPRWYDFLWYCYSVFVTLNRKGGAGGGGGRVAEGAARAG